MVFLKSHSSRDQKNLETQPPQMFRHFFFFLADVVVSSVSVCFVIPRSLLSPLTNTERAWTGLTKQGDHPPTRSHLLGLVISHPPVAWEPACLLSPCLPTTRQWHADPLSPPPQPLSLSSPPYGQAGSRPPSHFTLSPQVTECDGRKLGVDGK